MLVPAITQMLLEVEEDDETWEETVEDKDRLATDPVSTAASSLSRLTADLGEKTTLLCCQPIIGELIASGDSWIKRQAGFQLVGLIAETCQESYAKSVTEAMQTASMGVQDQHKRVRYEALGALGKLLTVLAPKAQ